MDRLTPPSRLLFSHIGIFVTDLERMKDFYTRVLGMVVTDEGSLPSGKLVFLSRDPREHHQLVLCTGRTHEHSFSTVNQLSWRLPDLTELRKAHALLEAAGAGDIQPINHGISWSVYARDPEGNRIEIFMDTPWYVPQPLREPLDLSLSDAEIERLSEQACVNAPGFKPMEKFQAETALRIAEALAR